MMLLKLPKEIKDEIINNVKNFFDEERSETIGDLGADQLIDFMIKELGPHIYNKAITDARNLIQEKTSQIEDELYSMEKPIHNRNR